MAYGAFTEIFDKAHISAAIDSMKKRRNTFFTVIFAKIVHF